MKYVQNKNKTLAMQLKLHQNTLSPGNNITLSNTQTNSSKTGITVKQDLLHHKFVCYWIKRRQEYR